MAMSISVAGPSTEKSKGAQAVDTKVHSEGAAKGDARSTLEGAGKAKFTRGPEGLRRKKNR